MGRRQATLAGLMAGAGSGMGSEHHHRDIQGGAARALVFGFSDGLVTDLAIILGVVGAHPSASVVRLAGLAGLLAGAFSMAAGEYISMRAQAELLERELSMEAREIERRPEAERRELAMIYERRGLDPEAAAKLAKTMMRDPATALSTHAREELGINPANLGSPWKASVSSLFATAFGSLVPLFPWLVSSGTSAKVGTLIASGAFAAAAGIALSRFTGRSWVFSAARQICVCGVSAAITFAVGSAMGTRG